MDAPVTPLDIAVVTETWPPEINGVALTLHRLVQEIRARGHRIQLIRPRQPGETIETPRDPFADNLLMPAMPLPNYPGLQLGLPATIAIGRSWRHRRPRIVHIATEGPLGWSALRAARRLGIPVTSDFRTRFEQYAGHYGLKLLERPIQRYLRRFHNRTELTFVPTRALRDELEGLGFQRLQVLGRGIDTVRFAPHRRCDALRQQWGIREHEVAILYVGRLAPEKNIATLTESVRTLRTMGLSVRLILVGDGPLRGELGRLDPAPIIAGTQTGTELARHYASADLFAFPSLSETFGNVIPEAMASGLAVLAYDRGAALELISDGVDGRVLRPESSHSSSFVEALASLARNPELSRSLGERARIRTLDLGWSAIAARFESCLLQTLAQASARGDASAPAEPTRPA
jgi:glycosyltransferase involved in cell wall biosynthesis